MMSCIVEGLTRSVCERVSELSVVVFTCETPAIADIVFLVDGSSSISRLNFKTVKTFLGMFVRAFEVGSDQTRIGLVLYGKDSWVEWHLNTHSTKEDVINAIRNLPYKGGNTLKGLVLYGKDSWVEWHLNTHSTKEDVINAIRNLPYKGGNTLKGTHTLTHTNTYSLENSFKAESGSRPDVPKIGILITDGKSQDDVLSPAQRLRDAGIELFAIGVKNADENELRAIASPPEETHVYNAADFSMMSCIVEGLTRSVCERVSELSGEEVVTASSFCVNL
ncbi:collagen alpha-1(XIV) chain-like [Sinocyclocheilus rhinocerous]|uniref:collagen alpha-1(XIV) chain-like n=1 Tax=Sinocyclocheilus rhinocerous TaxID=307959 RepID=UPI0007B94671|nr:PREDICTED: collagen alpha-1(XIV) chain-like [Sinocyclocheilus rhinocerous]